LKKEYWSQLWASYAKVVRKLPVRHYETTSSDAIRRLQAEVIAMDEEIIKPKKPGPAVGEDLSELSVEELQKRVVEFEDEIVRLKAEIDGKQSSKVAADSFFKL
jgi:uncharacterized small protein (DUF1192 family)